MASTTAGKTPMTLKSIPQSQIPPLDPTLRSDVLNVSKILANEDPRGSHLARVREGKPLVPPPLISSSEFVPGPVVELLMRKKKDSAIGVKFTAPGDFRTAGRKPDEITNMEGALHTFVTPVVGKCEMVGDYRWNGGHGVALFGSDGGEERDWRTKRWMVRTCVLSASIQMDFEGPRVMMRVCKLDGSEVLGQDLGDAWGMLDTESKQTEELRRGYDDSLRRHMVFHLTTDGRLPARNEVPNAMRYDETLKFLEGGITETREIADNVVGKYAELYNDQIVSLELLFNTAVHQVRNEFSALEAMCSQGYVYTYDPASIFAREIGAELLNRLMLAALRHLSNHNTLSNLRIFAINDYADRSLVGLTQKALEKQIGIRVASKYELFRGRGGQYDIDKFKEAEGALLVIHNNSDGFGQNIETEWESGSLDGAIGSNGSGAASLERNRPDLLDFVSPVI